MTPTATSSGGARGRVEIARVDDRGAVAARDELAVEAPLEIRIAGRGGEADSSRSIVVLRTPGADEELAAGLLFAEGVVRSRDEIESIESGEERGESVLTVRLDVDRDRLPTRRSTFISSSCGACGKAILADLSTRRRHPLRAMRPAVDPEVVHGLPEALRTAQSTFDRTGGLHAAGLFDPDGTLRLLREDVGRHNALDKLIGGALFGGGIPLADGILLMSGRTGFELVQKAIMAGAPVLASVGAPSSLAVDVARGCGMTLLGFVRDRRFNVYADCGRIRDVAGTTAAGDRGRTET